MHRPLLVAAAALGASGCFLQYLDTPTAEERGIPIEGGIDKMDHETESLFIVQTLVEDYFDVDLGDEYDVVDIRWTTAICPEELEEYEGPHHGVVYNGKCYAGIMFTCNELYVATDGEDICGTAMSHEFAHCLSFRVHGHYDGEHTGDIWGVVSEANKAICERGW